MKITLPQQDVYFDQLLYEKEPIYNIGAKAKIEGEINYKKFNRACALLIEQHDSFRSVFNQKQDSILVSYKEEFNYKIEFFDFSMNKDPDERTTEFIESEFIKPFDILGEKFLFRFILIKVSKQVHYLFLVCHHIITDGWGTSLMFQRFVKNYNELVELGEISSNQTYSYKEFISNDQDYQNSENYNVDKKYWVEKFSTLPEKLFHKINKTEHLINSGRKTLIIKRSRYNKLNDISRRFKGSTFHLLLASFYIYFGRKHQNNDFAIGLPVLNRSKSIFKKTVGLFMGVSPLRIQLDFEDTLQELILKIRNELRQDYRHQRFPLGKLINEVKAYQDNEKLFDITLSYEKQDYAKNFIATKTSVVPLTHHSERHALAIYIREFDEKEDVVIDFDYNFKYFDEKSISQILIHYEQLIKNILNFSNLPIYHLNYLTKQEENIIIKTFNNSDFKYPRDRTLITFFKKQVEEFPKKIAVSDNKKEYSYLALDKLSDQIAIYILEFSPKATIRNIGILMERSATTVAIMLGILKAGKSFIPLDPSFPEERLRYIVQHSDLKFLISDQERFKFPGVYTIFIKEFPKNGITLNREKLPPQDASKTAYIIYTSGSTGEPKGVEIGNQSLLNFLLSMVRSPGLFPDDTFFAVTTYSFDISILELFGPLMVGASVYIVNNEILNDPKLIVQTIEDVNPSIIQATPSFFQMLFNSGWVGKKEMKVFCGGDLLNENLASLLIKKCGELWNMYGPTETTIWSSVKQIKTGTDASNIGKPINNTRFYILDDFKKLVPIGYSGSLYIGGDGLAKGYYKNPKMTKQKFLPDLFNKETNLYDTNDICKWNSEGEVIFLGRNDNQVKIRGFRIELGEIETKLNEQPGIKQAIVVVNKNNNRDPFLVAYIIKEIEDYDEQKNIQALKNQLPSYMIPYTFSILQEFPRTTNLKVNRKELAQRKINYTSKTGKFQKPNTVLQEKLVDFWKEVFNYDGGISITENFFHFGGNSLNAVKLINIINSELDYEISLKTIFDFPSILLLSNYLSTIGNGIIQKIPKINKRKYYAVTPAQNEIWLASQHEQRSIAYNMVGAFNIEGTLAHNDINLTLNRLILENEILRTNFFEEKGNVYQKINDKDSINFKLSSETSNSHEVENKIKTFINEEFNLENDLLIKMKLIQTGDNKAVLVFCTHHLIMDGWSLEKFTHLFLDYYSNSHQGNFLQDRIQFKDFAEWKHSFIETKEDVLFWREYLEGYNFKPAFFPDHKVDKEDYKGSQFRFQLSIEETMALDSFIKKHSTTIHSFLISVLNIIVYKYSGNEDIVLGTVNAGRNKLELNNFIGMLVQTLPLRTKLHKENSFFTVLNAVQEGISLLDKYQNIPEKLKKKAHFDVLVVLQNPELLYESNLTIKGATLTPYTIDVDYCRFPLLFNFFQVNNKLNSIVSFNTNKFDHETVELIALKFKKLIGEILINPTCTLKDLDVSLEYEKVKAIDIKFNF